MSSVDLRVSSDHDNNDTTSSMSISSNHNPARNEWTKKQNHSFSNSSSASFSSHFYSKTERSSIIDINNYLHHPPK